MPQWRRPSTTTSLSVISSGEQIWGRPAEFAVYARFRSTANTDNPSAIVDRADPLGATINMAFLEYSQVRGFVIDPARARKAKDKARVERSVRDVRDDCYAGETIRDLAQARERGMAWCEYEYGTRRHATTGRMPKEYFLADEQARLLAAPQLSTTSRSGATPRSRATTSPLLPKASTACPLSTLA